MAAEVDVRYVWSCADCGDGSQFFDYREDAARSAAEHNHDNHDSTGGGEQG